MPTDTNALLHLQIDSGNSLSPDELDQLTRQLRRDLCDLDVESVDFSRSTDIPTGAKSAEVMALGSLAVAVLPVAVPKVIEFLRDWLLRGENRTLKMKLQVSGNSAEIEFNPTTIGTNDIELLAKKLTGVLGGQTH